MTSKLNPRWLAAAMVWSLAILVSYSNYSHIQEIATIREKNDGLRQEMLFQFRNAEQLNRVQSMQEFCSLPVASVQLGFESIRSRLYGLSANLGFQSIQIDAQMEQTTDNRVPFHLRMQGKYKNAGNFLSALQSIPYLAIKNYRIVADTAKPDAELELNFHLQYKIDPTQELQIQPLQAAADPLAPEAVAP
jgi:hypothetical protein